jgi:hypothetical protein
MAGDLSKTFRARENSFLYAKMGGEAGGRFSLHRAMKSPALALLIAIVAGCAPVPVIPVPDDGQACRGIRRFLKMILAACWDGNLMS